MSLRRIVVALDGSSEATFDTMIELARELEVELVGLFVEDTELLDAAALPFGETGFPTASRRALDVGAMERSLRAQARRIEREFGSRLLGRSVKWTFEVVRGRLGPAITAMAAEDDIVVVPVARPTARDPRARAHASRTARAGEASWLLVSDPRRDGGRIAIAPPPGAAIATVARVVAALAPHCGRSAIFVVDEALAGREKAALDDARELLAANAIHVRFRALAGASGDEIARLVAGGPSGIVVVLADTAEARDALFA